MIQTALLSRSTSDEIDHSWTFLTTTISVETDRALWVEVHKEANFDALSSEDLLRTPFTAGIVPEQAPLVLTGIDR